VRETIGLLRRTFSRLDVSSRSLFALIEPGSCFAGSFLELALACDRSYMLAARRRARAPRSAWTSANFGRYPMVTGQSRLAAPLLRRRSPRWTPCAPPPARRWTPTPRLRLGLVTSNPDDIDWADETRIAIEERVAMSPTR
jgi:benzoyl-CoA-dihydrodiol lyase